MKTYRHDGGHITKMATMSIYGKNPSKIFLSGTGGLISTKLGMSHRWLQPIIVCSNDDRRLTLTYFTERSNLVKLIYRKKWKLLIFQNFWSLLPETNWDSEDMWVLKVKVIFWPWPKVIYISKLKLAFLRNYWAILNQNIILCLAQISGEHFTGPLVLWFCTIPYKVISYPTIHGHVLLYRTRLFHTVPYKVISNSILQGHFILYPTRLFHTKSFTRLFRTYLQGRFVPCHVRPIHTLTYRVVVYPTLQGYFITLLTRSFRTIPHKVILYPTLQGLFVPYPTRLFRTLPYKVISYHIQKTSFRLTLQDHISYPMLPGHSVPNKAVSYPGMQDHFVS